MVYWACPGSRLFWGFSCPGHCCKRWPGLLSALVTSGAGWWLLRIQPRGRKLEGLGDGGIPSGGAIAGNGLVD